MRKLLLLLTLSTCVTMQAVVPATAQMVIDRMLPANGKRGVTGAPQPFPLVGIGRQVLKLSPGAVIYDQYNRTLLQGNLPQQAAILYSQDTNGLVTRIYVLTPAEEERLTRAGIR
jgi:hypothetical protein